MSSQSSIILSLQKLTKTFGDFKAIDNVSLDVARGEFLTLLGPSGSGKTTILMTVAGFCEPTHGHIHFEEQDITRLRPERRNFGVVFQGYALFPHMTVAENVAYPLVIRRIGRAEREETVKRTLDLVQMLELANRKPSELSGGQQQRVALARALVFDPAVLLLDEPLSALDKKLRAELQIELKSLHQRLGRTFINVTHDQEEALSMSDRIAILDKGSLQQLGSPKELYDQPATQFVAEFLGRSNFFTGIVSSISNGEATIITAGNTAIHQRLTGDQGISIGDSALVAVRPERLHLLSIDNDQCPANVVRATVKNVIFAGIQTHVLLNAQNIGVLDVTLASKEAHHLPAEGMPVLVTWAADQGTIVAEA